MLKYLKQKPTVSVLVIAVLAVTLVGILLMTKPSGELLLTSQASATENVTATQKRSEEASISQNDDAVSSASTMKPTATDNKGVSNDAPAKRDSTVRPTAKQTAKATIKPTAKPTLKPRPNVTNAPSSGSSYTDFQARVLSLVNKERTSRGLKPLTGNSKLSGVATKKSQDMADLGYFDHNSPTYGSPFEMMKQFGISYQTAGENIAYGQTTPEQVMEGWMNSEGHRANILNPGFKQLGVGIAKSSSGRIYWTQMFIG